MCGIAGLFDRHQPPTPERLERMAAPLARRGPDDYGHCLAGPVGLAHRRLSIIDLAGGHQPLYNEDRSLALVFNGEIYDFDVLRSELIAKGHTFATRSDSEVLLHLYEEEGRDMVHRLNGMFAFAIAELATGDLFIARDRLGQKPLFYAVGDGRFAFASGPRSLATLDWVDTAIDTTAIHDYLELQYLPAPHSIYRGVRKLPPGYTGTWRFGSFSLEQYWAPQVLADFTGSYADACAELRSRLTAAVRRRLVADVPLGFFLSGGLDSSIVTALGQQGMTQRAKTYSIAFPDPRYDEREFAARVAEHLGTEHHCLEVKPDDFGLLAEVVDAYEEPFCDASMLPTSLLSRFTRQHVTVALSGDAADELLGGYYRHRVMHLYRHLDLVPLPLRRAVALALAAVLPPKREERSLSGKLRRLTDLLDADGIARYWRILTRVPPGRKESLYGPAMAADAGRLSSLHAFQKRFTRQPRQSFTEAIMQLDLTTYLPDDVLVKVDRASMGYGLEVRSPFCDKTVVEFANRLPYAWKQRGRRRKMILADTFDGMLPAGIANRPKMGFGVPLAAWFRTSWLQPTRELLLDGRLVADGFFLRPPLARLLDEHVQGSADHSYLLYALLVLELWRRRP
jgi:asparagine synthase (glutamine-hydrolysing)